jgi:hypothetical protein
MPSLIADTADLHRRAAHIRGQADAVRHLAVQLARQVDAVHWESAAARLFRAHAHGVAMMLRHNADRLDHAADALDRHAARVHAEWELVAGTAKALAHTGQGVLHAIGFR